MVIIGAGPIGLLAAINLSALGVSITIYEKRRSYTRNQIVVLNPRQIKLLPKEVVKSGCFGYVNPVELDQSGETLKESHASQACVQLKHLEMELLKLVSRIENIKVIYKQISQGDLTEMLDRKKKTLFIGADGYNSMVRQMVKSERIICQSTYGVVAIYKRDDHTDETNTGEPNSRRDRIKKQCGVNLHHIMGIPQNRYRGFRATTNYNHISLQLTKREYESIDPSLTNKLICGSDLPQNIYSVLQSGADFYGMRLPAPNEIEVQVIPIQVFNAEETTYKLGTNTIILMGDAANGPNFISMSGVNKGIKMVKELSKIIRSTKNLDDIYGLYERNTEHILTDTLHNAFTYSLDEEIVQYLMEKYNEEELNKIGYLHNIYLNDLEKKEKCFVLHELYRGYEKENKIDRRRNQLREELRGKILKRMEMIEAKQPNCHTWSAIYA